MKDTLKLLALSLLATLAELPAAAASKPNILWISCEDTSPDLGCYGDRYATTPNLDQFAAEGCRFDRAYVTFPVCAPSRSSIIEADGLASNTIVFFWGDHGRGLPRYKRWPYRLGTSQNWQVFAGPFKAKEAVHAQAIRLGYSVSKEISQ